MTLEEHMGLRPPSNKEKRLKNQTRHQCSLFELLIVLLVVLAAPCPTEAAICHYTPKIANSHFPSGCSPLHLAASCANLEAVQL